MAVPLSLTAAGLTLYLRGATFNAVALAGLVMALGAIVDDGAADVDAIRCRFAWRRQTGSDASPAETIIAAMRETRGPAVYGTLIVLLALAPLFSVGFSGGLPSAILWPLAVSYGLALFASLAVALTVTPVLALLLNGSGAAPGASPLMRRLPGGYQRLLARLIDRPQWAMTGAAALLVIGFAIVPTLGQAMMPTFQDRDLLIHWETPPGTALTEMDRVTTLVSQELKSLPGVRNVGAHVGRAITSDQSAGVNSGEVWVSIDPAANYQTRLMAVNEVVSGYPGIEREIITYPGERVREILGGSPDALSVRLYGQDPEVLEREAEQVRALMATIDGVVAPHLALPVEEPSLEIEVDMAKASRFGIKPGDVRRAAAALLSGVEVGNLFDEQKVFEVVVRGIPATRSSLTSVQNLLIDTPEGGHVRLGEVASVRLAPSAVTIEHQAVSRYVDIGAGVAGRDAAAVARAVEQALASREFPLENYAELLGGASERQAEAQRLLGLVLAALIGILLLLQAASGSWKLAGMTFVLLPAALTGGLAAVFAGGGLVSLGALAGFLAVLGIAARNGIMMISHYQHLEREEGERFSPELIIRGARERLAPILMTALATGLALVPLVAAGSIPGHEIEHPMAVVILGGLVTSTLLNLFVVPTLYLHFGKGKRIGVPRRLILPFARPRGSQAGA